METTSTTTKAASVRGLPQKARTALIRKALKDAGIKGASVTSAPGWASNWTNVRVAMGSDHPAFDWQTHVAHACEFCAARLDMSRRIERIILAAYPDLGDRSDAMTDHFDFMFTVEVR